MNGFRWLVHELRTERVQKALCYPPFDADPCYPCAIAFCLYLVLRGRHELHFCRCTFSSCEYFLSQNAGGEEMGEWISEWANMWVNRCIDRKWKFLFVCCFSFFLSFSILLLLKLQLDTFSTPFFSKSFIFIRIQQFFLLLFLISLILLLLSPLPSSPLPPLSSHSSLPFRSPSPPPTSFPFPKINKRTKRK